MASAKKKEGKKRKSPLGAHLELWALPRFPCLPRWQGTGCLLMLQFLGPWVTVTHTYLSSGIPCHAHRPSLPSTGWLGSTMQPALSLGLRAVLSEAPSALSGPLCLCPLEVLYHPWSELPHQTQVVLEDRRIPIKPFPFSLSTLLRQLKSSSVGHVQRFATNIWLVSH